MARSPATACVTYTHWCECSQAVTDMKHDWRSVLNGGPFRLAGVAFLTAFAAAAVGFVAFFGFGSLLVARISFVVIACCVALQVVGIIWGTLRHGGQASRGSVRASGIIRTRIRDALSRILHPDRR
jgi:hypothetical protein